jgi:hypothetical protein
MTSSYVTYIDESGCDGFRIGCGSSEWMVLSGVVFRKHREPSDVKVVDEVLVELGRTKDLHFSDLRHEQRILYISKIDKCRIRCVVIAIHKPSLNDKGTFQVKNRLYHYAIRLLMERVSWLCVEHFDKKDGGDGTTELIFSHRRTLSYEQIKEYLCKLKTQGTEIDWETINPDLVRALPHKARKGLWLADCVASGFFYGLEKNRFGFTEGRYAEMLRPVIWGRNQVYSGTGIKIYPKEALVVLDFENLHQWLTRSYGFCAK